MARGLRLYQCKGCGRTFNALSGTPLSGLTQGTLAVVRGVAGEGGDEGLGGALRRGGEHGVPLASPVSGGGAERFGGAQGDRGSGRDLRPGEPEGRRGLGRKARRRGGKAKKRGLSREQVPVLMAPDGRFCRPTGAERRSARCCPGSMRRRSRLPPSTRWSRRTPDWSPTVARATPLAPPRSGCHGHSIRSIDRGDLHVQTVNSRHSRLKDFLRPRRGIESRQLPELVPPRWPRPRPTSGRPKASAISFDRSRPVGLGDPGEG